MKTAKPIQFDPPLVPATLRRRYKRFLADVTLADGSGLTVHCPNTGSMLGLDRPGIRVWIRDSANAARKYPWSWELAEPEPGRLVGINTGLSNRLVQSALEAGMLPSLQGFDEIRREVRQGNSRLDFQLRASASGESCFLEVKNVTAAVVDGLALFPDAVSERASRHLRELVELKRLGHRCGLVYCVQRDDVTMVEPAREIDPVYARTLEQAVEQGVEVYALGASLSPQSIVLDRAVRVAVHRVP